MKKRIVILITALAAAIGSATAAPSVLVNVARAGTATAYSVCCGANPARYIDGDKSFAWGNGMMHTGGNVAGSTDNASGGYTNPWGEINLGRDVNIQRVTYYGRNECGGGCLEQSADVLLSILAADRSLLQSQQNVGTPPANPIWNWDLPFGEVGRIVRAERILLANGYMSTAEIEVGECSATATALITTPPAPQNVEQSRKATFGPVVVTASGITLGEVSYQWQVNGADIPGATGLSYTTGLLVPADSGSTYTF